MFRDRAEAGRRLAVAVREAIAPDSRPLVLALPRGGVPVAREVATALGAPLDVLVVRKVGAPANPEFAVGAIAEGDVRLFDPESGRYAGVVEAEFDRLAAREHEELDRRVSAYRGRHRDLHLTGRTVVLVDDGIATGATALAAVRSVRRSGAERIVLAVPVAPSDWRDGPLAAEADVLVAVEETAHLGAVGAYYRHFAQVSDGEVLAALGR